MTHTVRALVVFASLFPMAAFAAATPPPRAQTQSRPVQVQQQQQPVRQLQQQVIRQPYQPQQQAVRQQQVIQQPYHPQQQAVRQQQVIQQPYQPQQQPVRQHEPQYQQQRPSGATYANPVYRPAQTQTQTQSHYSKGEATGHAFTASPPLGEPRSVDHPGSRPEVFERRVPTEFHVLRHEPEHVPAVVHRGAFEHRIAGLREGRIRDVRIFRSISAYHRARYHTVVVTRYVSNPELYHGYWSDGWYHGYWHSYWANEPWTRYMGNYGFWVQNGELSTFVYETSPGVCSYWNGADWVSWYDPPASPDPCPY